MFWGKTTFRLQVTLRNSPAFHREWHNFVVLETIWRWNCSFNSKPPVLWWVKRNLPTEQTSCPGLQWVVKKFFSGNILYSATFSRQQSRSMNIVSYFLCALPQRKLRYWQKKESSLSPLHPNISIHILHTLLHKFLMVLTRRIYLKIKAS